MNWRFVFQTGNLSLAVALLKFMQNDIPSQMNVSKFQMISADGMIPCYIIQEAGSSEDDLAANILAAHSFAAGWVASSNNSLN